MLKFRMLVKDNLALLIKAYLGRDILSDWIREHSVFESMLVRGAVVSFLVVSASLISEVTLGWEKMNMRSYSSFCLGSLVGLLVFGRAWIC